MNEFGTKPVYDESLPDYVPLSNFTRVETLVVHSCGAVVPGDAGSQRIHNMWHEELDHNLRGGWMPPMYQGKDEHE